MEKEINNFHIGKYKITLQPTDTLHLPEYKGSTIRGGFGTAFRRLVCVLKKNDCKNCILKEKCIYKFVFEPTLTTEIQKALPVNEIPRPFVIEPPEETKTKYSSEDILNFNLILFGKAINYLPYFILTFKNLGQLGLGKNRTKFNIIDIKDVNGNIIYSSSDETFHNIDSCLTFDKIISNHCNHTNHLNNLNHLTIKFISPTRIKLNHKLISKPEFHQIIKLLLLRISSLSYLYCDIKLNLNHKQIIESAKNVKIKSSTIKWYDWKRYSTRQKTSMTLGGFKGEICYEGGNDVETKKFLPLLLLGQYTHIGKNTTFGLGKYEII